MVWDYDYDAPISVEVHQTRPTGGRPRGQPGTCWRDYISGWVWEGLGGPSGRTDVLSFTALHNSTATPCGLSEEKTQED